MSSVYLARHVLIDRLVAVKVLRRDLAQDPIQRDRFIREARAVNRVNHDNIVEITDFGESEDGLVYLVMEYVPGESLLKALVDAPFSPQRSLDIVEQIGTALARAHQMGVVHRDLKPENVILVPRKEGGDFVKVLDFGIAKILDAPSLTGSQQIFGTPGYIAPEYIQSTAIDGRADLYSLGVILYEMVTAALPFDYEYPGDLLVKHVTEPPIPPRQRAEVDPAIEGFILRCLEKDPRDRFRDAYHFLEELRTTRERLGGDAWGAMGTQSSPGIVAPPPREAVPTQDAERDEDGAAEGGMFDDKTVMDEDNGFRTFAADDESGGANDGDAEGDRPDTDEMDRSQVFPTGEGFPTPPQVISTRRESEAPSQGLAGVRRWRARYDALTEAVSGLGTLPPDIADALEFSSQTLGSLEGAIAHTEALQAQIDELGVEGRDFKTTLGRAIDQLGERLSRARGALETSALRRSSLRHRHEGLAAKVRTTGQGDGEADAVLWELATVEQAVAGHAAECDDLESKIADLRAQLDRRDERVEAHLASLVTKAEAEMSRLDALSAALREPLDRVERFVQERWAGSATPA
jgi:serine/threonine-protein kinase